MAAIYGYYQGVIDWWYGTASREEEINPVDIEEDWVLIPFLAQSVPIIRDNPDALLNSFVVIGPLVMRSALPKPPPEDNIVEIDWALSCPDSSKFFTCLKTHFVGLRLLQELGSGTTARVWAVSYGDVKEALRICKTDSLPKFAKQQYFNWTEERMGGEWYGLLEYNSPYVLKARVAIAWDKKEEGFRVITQAEVMAIFRNPQQLSGNTFTLYATLSEYFEGAITLQEEMEQKDDFSAAEIQNFARQILEGLAAIHRTAPHLTHRDLKPGNILKTPAGTFKIFDFGFSKVCSARPLEQSVCGSPLFMAPELFTDHIYDERLDSYSIYTILFKMATKHYPIEALNIYQFSMMVTFVVQQDRDPSKDKRLEHLEPQLRDLIVKLGRLNFQNRIKAEEALLHPALR